MKYISFLLWLLPATVCLAVEVEQGKLYSSGTYVESSQTGVGLTIPKGWQGAWPPGSEIFVLESAALKANIFMVLQPGDEAGLKSLLSNTIPLDSGIQLVPASSPKKTGKIYTANYTVTGAPQISAYIAAQILPPSLGIALIALSADASTTLQVKQATLKLASSLVVKQAAAQPVANISAANSGGDLWKDYFKGRYIARYFSGSGYNEDQQLWLCSDGRFFRKSGSGGYNMSGASGASSSRGEGVWTATGSTGGDGQLILQFGVGSVSETSTPGADYNTSSAGGERWTYRVSLGKALYLNEKKWLRGKNDLCN